MGSDMGGGKTVALEVFFLGQARNGAGESVGTECHRTLGIKHQVVPGTVRVPVRPDNVAETRRVYPVFRPPGRGDDEDTVFPGGVAQLSQGTGRLFIFHLASRSFKRELNVQGRQNLYNRVKLGGTIFCQSFVLVLLI